MAKIIISENITLDGVVEDPTGEEGSRHGGWFAEMGDRDRDAWATLESAEVQQAEALLLGRGTYEFFAARWPSRAGAWADRLNTMPKYVVSSTLVEPAWSNATVLSGDVVREVNDLRRRLDGEIIVYGSRPLAQTLLEHDLADELRLIVFPVVVGIGERLFGATTKKQTLRLLGVRPVGAGLTHVRYGLVADASGRDDRLIPIAHQSPA